MRVNYLSIPFIATFLFIFQNLLLGQTVKSYNFSVSQGSYPTFSGGTILGDATTDDELFIDSTDLSGNTGTQTGIGFGLGFGIDYGGTVYNRLAVSANGYVKLGNGSFRISNSSTILNRFTGSDSSNYTNIICAYNDDIEAINNTSRIRLLRQDGPNGKEMIIQWVNYKHYGTSNDGDTLNFHIRIMQSGRIEIQYGKFIKTSSNQDVGVGIRGQFIRDFHNRLINLDSSTTWASSKRSNAFGSKAKVNPSNTPQSGLTYIFQNVPPTPDNLGLNSIILPSGYAQLCKPTQAAPISLQVINVGTAAQSSFSVGYQVNSENPVVVNVDLPTPLSPSSTTIVEFPSNPVDLTNSGLYVIKCFVDLPSEDSIFRINDTLIYRIKVVDTISTPTQTYSDYDALINDGWKKGTGVLTPTSFGSSTWSSVNYGGQPGIVVNFPGPSTTLPVTLNEWIWGGPFIAKPDMSLVFKVAAARATTTGIPAMGDDSVNIVYSTNCGQTWKSIFSVAQSSIASNAIGRNFKAIQIPLTSITQNFLLGFVAKTTTTNTSGNAYSVYFDEIKIKVGNQYDIQPISISVPDTSSSSCSLSQVNLLSTIKNNGSNPVNSFSVGYRVNNGSLVNKLVSLSTPLLKGESTKVLFSGSQAMNIATNSIYTVKLNTSMNTEDIFTNSNDTISGFFPFRVEPTSVYPDSNLFDTQTSASNWFVDQNSVFRMRFTGQRGISVNGLATGAFSGIANAGNPICFFMAPKVGPMTEKSKIRIFYRLIEESAASTGTDLLPGDSIVFSYSKSCGVSQKTLKSFNSSNYIKSANYRQLIFDMDTLQGTSINLFGYVSLKRFDFAGARFEIENYSAKDFVPTSDEELIVNDRFAMYPNPAKDVIHFELFNSAKEANSVEILDLNGRVVKQIELSGFNNDTQVNVSDIRNGLYYARVRFGNNQSIQKILIQK